MINDFSEVTAGRPQRLSKLDQALSLGQYDKAWPMALQAMRESQEIVHWLAARLPGRNVQTLPNIE